VPPARANFGTNPEGEGWIDPGAELECRFSREAVGGLTPKFNCDLADGTVVKVKYGRGNAELHAEVAATRLLAALGFPADRMYVVKNVRCAGCPRFPFSSLRCMAATGMDWPCVPGRVDFERTRSVSPAVVERRLAGRRIEAFPGQGWAWYELDTISPAEGGSTRAEVDALRLLAAFLAHWDNKAENQRLVCPAGDDLPDGGCARPLAMMQDVGGTFGPAKLDLPRWRRTPVWADPSACLVSMKGLPWGGGTFPDRRISEEGRLFLLGLLEQLAPLQLTTLFRASGVGTFDAVSAETRSASAWADVFLDKVRQIREGGPCQSLIPNP